MSAAQMSDSFLFRASAPGDLSFSSWLSRNIDILRRHYAGQYIAFNLKGIVSNHAEFEQMMVSAKHSGQKFSVYYVPKRSALGVFAPIYIRSISRHPWLPLHDVQVNKHGEMLQASMLVDSGADFSVVPLSYGRFMGFEVGESEVCLPVYGIGGVAEHVMRDLTMTIDGHTFTAPVAWLQTDDFKDMILGREVVFDKFNIEFRQADEQIIFTWRGDS
jgi:hypothetical protein